MRLGSAPFPKFDAVKFGTMEAMRMTVGERGPISWVDIGKKLEVDPRRAQKLYETCLQRGRDLGFEDMNAIRMPSRVYDVPLRRSPYNVLTEEEVLRLVSKATEDKEQRRKGYMEIAAECGLSDIPAEKINRAFKSENFRRASLKTDRAQIAKGPHAWRLNADPAIGRNFDAEPPP